MTISLLRCSFDICPGVMGSESDPQDPGPLCISEDLRTNSILATSLILSQLARVIWPGRENGTLKLLTLREMDNIQYPRR